jgi:hypothetical protein
LPAATDMLMCLPLSAMVTGTDITPLAFLVSSIAP